MYLCDVEMVNSSYHFHCFGKNEQFVLTQLTQLRMKTIYLIQLQIRNSKEQPSQPVAVPRENLIKFINENLSSDVVMLISSVECYGD